MAKKQYSKSAARMFVRQIVRLLSIAAIFLVTISLISGLGDVPDIAYQRINKSYNDDNIHDLLIRMTISNQEEMTAVENKLDNLKDTLGISGFEKYYAYDQKFNDGQAHSYRCVFHDSSKNNIDKLEVLDGNLPNTLDEVAIDQSVQDDQHRKVGDEITFPSDIPLVKKAKVVGIIRNPIDIMAKDDPSDYYDYEKDIPDYITDYYYFDLKSFPSIITNNIPASLRITLTSRNNYPFDDAHKNLLNQTKLNIEATLKSMESEGIINASHFKVITIFDNYSLVLLNETNHKISTVAICFIVFFTFIAILVVYSTMSRLLDEDRQSIATLKTLGYSNFSISMRYIIYVFLAGLIGVMISLGPGYLVKKIISSSFNITYSIVEVPIPIAGTFYFAMSIFILLAAVALIAIKSVKVAKQKPVELLTHKAPKVGKKVLLEHIKPLWRRLPFKYKSTIRNIFLFKSRLIMTVLSIVGSTALVFASFVIFNKSFSKVGFDSLRMVSAILLIFSGSLSALIIYNVTNINVCERTREIATLMVLGYRDNETCNYVYREIYVLSIIGALIGLPGGVLFVQFVFSYVNLGGLEDAAWWCYVVTPFITILFTFLTTFLLHHKIVKTDMNESLKVLE